MIRVYDPEKHRMLAFVYGADPRIVCQSYGANALWMLGFPDAARSWIEEASSRAGELTQGHSEAIASCFRSLLQLLLRDAEAALEAATVTGKVSKRYGIQQFLVWSAVYRGWARSQTRKPTGAAEEIKAAIETWKGMGNRYLLPHFLGLLADALAREGQVAEALGVLASALQEASDTAEGFMVAELHRLRGELLLLQVQPSQYEAEAEFMLAHEIAHKQGAKSLALRSAVSTARLWREQGKAGAAQELLAGALGIFTEGFETTDLKEARAFLSDLQGLRSEGVTG